MTNKTITSYLPWIEKYRPKYLDDIMYHSSILNTLKNAIAKNGLQHLLFHGPPGTGKTSTILACAKELYGNKMDLMTLYINASEERGIEIVRTRILQFVNTKNIFSDDNIFKIVILDEADAMTADAQAMLRKVIEKYSSTSRFCLVCNQIKKITLALQSRCSCYRFSPLDSNSIKNKVMQIAQAENLNVTNEGIETIIKISRGDLRKVINILQSTSLSYNTITCDSVIKCTGYISIADVQHILKSLVNDSFCESYDFISQIKKQNSYALVDILTEISGIIVTYCQNIDNTHFDSIINIDKFILLDILNKMAEIEYNLSSCTNDDIQTSAFIGLFKSDLVKINN